MGVHLLLSIKLKYVLRAIVKHEEISKLGAELVSLGLSNSKGSNGKHSLGWNQPGTITIYQWIYRFMIYGVFGLGRMSSKMNNKVNPDNYTKEELIDAIHILRKLLKIQIFQLIKIKLKELKIKIEIDTNVPQNYIVEDRLYMDQSLVKLNYLI